MKKILFVLALLLGANTVMAQSAEDKAKAKAEAAALKAAQKLAKQQMNDAMKLAEELKAKISDTQNPVQEETIVTDAKTGLMLIDNALSSGYIAEKDLGEAYKTQAYFAMMLHNLNLGKAANHQEFDTISFLPTLIAMTDGLHNELKYTKVVKGETGNENELKQKKDALSRCKDYYVYAGQFESDCKRNDNAVKAYEIALDFTNRYPLVAEIVTSRMNDSQIAYQIYYAGYAAKDFAMMDKYYDQAIKFDKGAEGVKQLRAYRYLEQGDTLKWAEDLKEQVKEDPTANEDNIQRLLSFYQSRGIDAMVKFADEMIAVAPQSRIAYYGKGYALFTQSKYEEALECYKKCADIDPTYYDAWYQAGMCKYREAIDLNQTIESIKNQVQAKATKEKTKKLFGDAIPYFEKARECTPDAPSKWAFELKACYRAIGNDAKAAEMDALL